MNNQKRLTLIAVCVLIAGTAVGLNWLKAHQKLGTPGIKAVPIPGSAVMKIELPERVLDFTSTNVPTSKLVLDYLPKDTSYAQRHYWAPDGFESSLNIILMGADRTSIHKPEYCLPGQGWTITRKEEVSVTIDGLKPYQMPVAKWTASKTHQRPDGSIAEGRALYVFWFVADNEQTVRNNQRMWWLTRDLLRKGVLQRWAYVSYFVGCAPGQEDAAFERLKKLIAASAPEFQLPPGSSSAASVAKK